MNIDSFDAKDFLPYYLTEDQKIGLAQAMKTFPKKSNIFTSLLQDQILQGDCWDKAPIVDVVTGQSDRVRVMLLSNSCDIDPSNKRDLPVSITYAPVIDFDLYRKMLEKQGVDVVSIEAKLNAIREQKITNLFFVPSGNIDRDGIVLLDRVLSIPYSYFAGLTDKIKLASLNQFGHFLLAFKLSIHFCRLHEGIARG